MNKPTKPLLKSFVICGAIFCICIAAIHLLKSAKAASPTDWHNNEVSEQISQQARAEARKLWREENGDWQPNLTPQAEQELLHYTAQKQKELNRGKQ
ncbi:hypothetical protein [Rodentibacter ratti]|uniref:Uncharacterized protein n=1 Tax=Rodentibacter ratti TaxID=1906745 RepID=A0A1V3L5L2_9PAST|nr:hypothetical protein [Rodentibacter ratti]OOF85091.1 hypothetical protein BKG88_08995 [Rodentibacter ratti]